ncbi:sulfate permease and related transporter, partial [Myxococcota bacterium]|nr:sulfate permease and related transporter [Myxococcota bacterium]
AIDLARQGVGAEAGVLLLMLIGLLAGLIQIGLGLVGVGRLIKYIPYSVVCGYLSGVGLTIIGGQLPRVLGVPREMGFWQALTTPSAWHWQSIVVGVVVVLTMALVPRVVRVVPAAIIAMLAGVAAYLLLGLADPALWNIAGNPLVIGPLGVAAGGLPEALLRNVHALAAFDPARLPQVLLPALTLAVLL